MTIRPLLAADVPAARTATYTALEALHGENVEADERAIRLSIAAARMSHLQATDPGGCWVAECDGEIVGAALSLIREDVLGYSLLALLPSHQGLGLGTRLHEAVVRYGQGARGGICLSHTHPAAMRLYATTPGYRLIPTVALSGAWPPQRMPSGLRCRPGDVAGDAPTIEAVSRHVRGASHLRDLPVLLNRPGAVLLVIDGQGFACAHNGTVKLLAAHTQEAATDLLWGAMASGTRGGTISINWVTEHNGWAIDASIQAGLALRTCGPMFVRGELGALAPFLPNGAYL